MGKDFPALAEIVEEDTRRMHEVMRTSTPALNYLAPATEELMRLIPAWRAGGLPVAYTIDAGPNVHCLCPAESAGGGGTPPAGNSGGRARAGRAAGRRGAGD